MVTDASSAGLWRAVVGPVRVRGTMTVLAPRVGDTLNVFQIVSTPGTEVSLSRSLIVTAPR
ncbi:MAG: hypothetical protein IPN17_17205 [Deltaproteobacteria bacterium]|nr:hypothetical protein [Deltaproteobacteria bacterium]